MSSKNKEFNFSEIIPLGVDCDTNGGTFYSWRPDAAKREIAVASALQILNSHAQSADSGHVISQFHNYLPKMTKAILDALEGKDQ